MSSFVKEVADYFQNFLETDFRKRKLPKRNIVSTNKDGARILINLDKYLNFKKELYKKINNPNTFDFSFLIKPNTYTTTINKGSTDFILKNILESLPEKKEDITSKFKTELTNTFIKYTDDIEKFYEDSDDLVCEMLAKDIFDSSSISATLDRRSEDDSITQYEVENQLGIALFERSKENFHSLLLDFSVKKDAKIFNEFFSTLLSKENIKIVIDSYFSSLSISDLFQDLSILNTEIRAKENFEIYLYIGELQFNKKSFPIAFIPIEIDDKSSGVLKISFEKRYFINKQAIEYAHQQVTGRRDGTIATLIPDRTINLKEEQNIIDDVKDLITNLANRAFAITDSFQGNFKTTSSLTSQNLKIKNSFFLTIADKGDESALNDYEEITRMIDSEGELFSELSSLINSFIGENPKNIAEKIRSGWKKLSTQNRLVYESPIPVNEEQRKIIAAVNSKDARFITVQGPPGTGKSHTISAILFRAIKDNKSVLMLSDKKEALDVVEDKLVDTLNKVRTDKDFQNPILRIGKSGNTYAKILSRNSIDNIRNNYEATRETLNRRRNNLESEIKSLKSSIKETVSTYGKIKAEDISSYFKLKEDLKIDDESESNLNENSKEVIKLKSQLLSLKKSYESLEGDEKKYIDSFKESSSSIAKVALMADIVSIQEFRLLQQKFSSFKIEDAEIVKKSIKEYRLKESSVWGSIFGPYMMLFDWQKNLIKALNLKETVNFRSKSNIKILEAYDKILSKVKKANDKKAVQTLDLLLNFDKELNLDKKRFKNLEAAYHDCKVQLKSLSKDDVFKENFNFLFSDSDLLSRAASILKKLESIVLFNGFSENLKKNFNNLKDIRYFDNCVDIQQDTTLAMTQEFDKRFLDFAENQANDARTFRNVISKKQKFPKEHFHLIKNAFPCIIAGIRDYADYIPLDKGVFDLLIIDEASQVSIAQAFPALIRAKKVLVLGDTKQFSNVKSSTASNEINQSFLNSIRSKTLEEFGDDELINERAKVFNVRTSILDFFEYTNNYSALLKKHFRGYPELISFSSKYFYEGSLQALKVRGKPIEDVIDFNFVEHDGKVEIYKNINTPEAKEIIKYLEKQAEKDNPESIGVITPFRDQQRYILGEVDKSSLRSDIYGKLKLKVMTFDSCQGEERDHIMYSFVENTVPESTTKCSSVLGAKFEADMDPEQNLRLQRLNVGMSRAKEKITFVLSQEISDFSGNALLILNHYKEQLDLAKKVPEADQTESPMERKLLGWITKSSFYQKNQNNLEITAQFKVGDYIKALDPTYKHPKYRCDFLMQFRDGNKEKKAIIEYDGFEYHFNNNENIGEFNYESYYTEHDIERERILEGYGFPFLRFNKFNLGKDPVETVSEKLNSFFLPNR